MAISHDTAKPGCRMCEELVDRAAGSGRGSGAGTCGVWAGWEPAGGWRWGGDRRCEAVSQVQT